MEITRIGTLPSTKGPEDWFTGTVRIDPLFQTEAPARAALNTKTEAFNLSKFRDAFIWQFKTRELQKL